MRGANSALQNERNIYLVDRIGREPSGDATGALLQSLGMAFCRFSADTDGSDALQGRPPGCVLIDIDAAGAGAGAVFDALMPHRARLPIVVIATCGDPAAIIDAMRRGATDFLMRPVEPAALLASLARVFDRISGEQAAHRRQQAARHRIEALTAREREILQGLLGGQVNKTLAHRLGISIRTIEMHRANLMTKLGVQNLAQAIFLTFASGMEFDGGLPGCSRHPSTADIGRQREAFRSTPPGARLLHRH